MLFIIGVILFGILYFVIKKADIMSDIVAWLKELVELLAAGLVATLVMTWLWSFKTLRMVLAFLDPVLSTLGGKVLAAIILCIIFAPFIAMGEAKGWFGNQQNMR